jgi:ubiquinone/menaquinone biosynthesis C-methylase UbiE
MATQEIDRAKSQAFSQRMITMVNDGMLALMATIGHQTGLFDTMAGMPPATSEQIADNAGLTERYVREWLGAMVAGRIVEYDPLTRTYRLPPEHAGWLTRAAGQRNLAATTQFVPFLAGVLPQVTACFRAGGGVPYDAYRDFHALMAETSARTTDALLLKTALPQIPGVVERLQAGIDVADMGCGSGHALNVMADAFPASRFTGFDISEEGLAAGRVEAERLGLTNVRFERQDVSRLDLANAFDLITVFDAIHDQVRPAEALRAIARALRPGGTLLVQDIRASSELHENLEHPLAPFGYTVSCLHCMTVSLAEDGAGLGAMWGEQTTRRMLAEAGFPEVEVKPVPGNALNSYYIARKA